MCSVSSESLLSSLLPFLPFVSSLLLCSYFFWSLRTSHQAILPSHHHSIFPLPLLEQVSSLFSASFFFSSVLLLSSFLLWSLRTSHQAINPSLWFDVRFRRETSKLPTICLHSCICCSPPGFWEIDFCCICGGVFVRWRFPSCRALSTSNFVSGHRTITPSFHLPFASRSLARRNTRSG